MACGGPEDLEIGAPGASSAELRRTLEALVAEREEMREALHWFGERGQRLLAEKKALRSHLGRRRNSVGSSVASEGTASDPETQGSSCGSSHGHPDRRRNCGARASGSGGRGSRRASLLAAERLRRKRAEIDQLREQNLDLEEQLEERRREVLERLASDSRQRLQRAVSPAPGAGAGGRGDGGVAELRGELAAAKASAERAREERCLEISRLRQELEDAQSSADATLEVLHGALAAARGRNEELSAGLREAWQGHVAQIAACREVGGHVPLPEMEYSEMEAELLPPEANQESWPSACRAGAVAEAAAPVEPDMQIPAVHVVSAKPAVPRNSEVEGKSDGGAQMSQRASMAASTCSEASFLSCRTDGSLQQPGFDDYGDGSSSSNYSRSASFAAASLASTDVGSPASSASPGRKQFPRRSRLSVNNEFVKVPKRRGTKDAGAEGAAEAAPLTPRSSGAERPPSREGSAGRRSTQQWLGEVVGDALYKFDALVGNAEA